MPSPFPGMDPYLETPDRWHNVHDNLVTEIQAQLAPLIVLVTMQIKGLALSTTPVWTLLRSIRHYPM